MILEYYGHSMFRISLAGGPAIVMDPYYAFYDYPARRVTADVCSISHHHSDHDGLASLAGSPRIIDTPGDHQPLKGVTLTGIPTWHDDAQGAKRGGNLIFLLETEGLRIAHLGDLGHGLTQSQAAALHGLDILLLPVGGYYTIDGAAACHVMARLAPKLTIPMHYQTAASAAMPIAPLADFLALCPMVSTPTPAPLLRITREDIGQRPPLMVMTTPEGL